MLTPSIFPWCNWKENRIWCHNHLGEFPITNLLSNWPLYLVHGPHGLAPWTGYSAGALWCLHHWTENWSECWPLLLVAAPALKLACWTPHFNPLVFHCTQIWNSIIVKLNGQFKSVVRVSIFRLLYILSYKIYKLILWYC